MRTAMFLAILLSAPGCGRIGYDPVVRVVPAADAATELPPSSDAVPDLPAGVDFDVAVAVDLPDDKRPVDVPPADHLPEVSADLPPRMDLPPDTAPPVCNQPFSMLAAVNIPGVSGDLHSPRLGPDGLTLYFGEQQSINPSSADIYFATRTVFGGPFSAPQPIAVANSNFEDGGAFLTGDRLELFFFSRRPGGPGGRDLWVMRRPTAAGAWGGPTPVSQLNSGADDYMPSLTADGLTIAFTSNRTASVDSLWVARRPSRTAPFGAPTEALELLALGFAPRSSFIQGDGLVVFMSVDTEPGPGEGRDLFSASRATPTGYFGLPMNLGPLFGSTASDEDDPALSLDGRELFFTSDVTGSSRIYRAVRCP
jgi:hypothetical protein